MNDMARVGAADGGFGSSDPAPHAAVPAAGAIPASRSGAYLADGTVPIGEVLEISGAGSRVAIDLAALRSYANEADAIACQMSTKYQQLFAQLAHLLVLETITHSGYVVIST